MAQSIKLNNDLYWHRSSVYGADLYTSSFTIPANGSYVFTPSENERGMLFTCGLTADIDSWGLYGLLRQGTNYSYIKTMIPCGNLTVSRNGSTHEITISNSSQYVAAGLYMGTTLMKQ